MPLRLLRWVALVMVSAWMLSCNHAQAGQVPAPLAEWTVLVFMNGDNDLEDFALRDFEEMARVGSTEDVRLVVQLDRAGLAGRDLPRWSQTLRFHVQRGMKPILESASEDLGEVNMGSRRAVEEFVTWGMARFPARRYALIIWDHGQGYRPLEPVAGEGVPVLSDVGRPKPAPRVVFQRSSNEAPHRSVSHDMTNEDELYNAELVSAVKAALAATGESARLELLGFDACLMAMVETAYAFRDLARVMVGSEELVPANGWQYEDWVSRLVAEPSMDGPALGRLLVDSYRRRYTEPPGELNPDASTTLSAVDLSGFGEVARSVSALAEELRRALPKGAEGIQAARRECRNYAPRTTGARDEFFHVDFIHFCERLLANDVTPAVKAAASLALQRMREAVIASYAGAARQEGFGTSGLAIYFPSGRADYRRDRYVRHGYEKENTYHPVTFVQDHQWVDFLHAYFEVSP
ncbi:clostripain-related cysteine peptidase [Myxococcus stipitatus]|uniref:clostripain-related cysteine peptidase n=1 Tax=Myxococcus stipitatus TaxID=83455 RepID=UPI0030CDF115